MTDRGCNLRKFTSGTRITVCYVYKGGWGWHDEAALMCPIPGQESLFLICHRGWRYGNKAKACIGPCRSGQTSPVLVEIDGK